MDAATHPDDPALQTADLLIVGSGAAGLTAALTASIAGLRPLVIEKTEWVGGTTALSEGMVWIPCSRQARDQGIEDRIDDALRYLSSTAGPHFDRERAAAYVENASSMLAFVEDHSHVRFDLVRGSMDYDSDAPGNLPGGRALRPGLFDARRLGDDFALIRPPLATTMLFGGMPILSTDLPHYLALSRSWHARWRVSTIVARYLRDRLAGWHRGTRIANGNGLIASLLLSLRERGVRVRTRARLLGLQTVAGSAAGARIDFAGRITEVRAARGVVLCGGGFPGDSTLTAAHFPHVRAGKHHVRIAPATNSGDTLRAALALGATLGTDLQNAAAWSPVSLVPQRDGSTIPFPHYIDRGKPGVIAVNPAGVRFTNESDAYQKFVPAMVATCADLPQVEAYLCTDHRALRRYGLGVVPPAPSSLSRFLRSGYLVTGDTPAALARALGIPQHAFETTIARFNEGAERGVDPEYGKGTTAYQRASGDPEHRPNPCIAPLRDPPYYAIKLLPGDIGTFVGLRTDASARVIDVHGAPIRGLYAAGNDMMTVMGGQYPAAGITVGAAMTFGHVAARTLIDDSQPS